MIELYTGTPGSGKSLHCAKVIYKKLCRRKNVIANFDINLTVFGEKRIGEFVYMDNSELSPELLVKYAMTKHKRNTNGNISEGQTLLVIDECQILFNSRDWNAKDRMKWATFFTQHRKFGYNIILITQFDRLIDRQIRSLVEYQIIHRKISNFKTIGFFLGLMFKGNLFVAITQWYGIREKIDSEFFILLPRYMRLYDSYKIFNTDDIPQTEAKKEEGGEDVRDDNGPCAAYTCRQERGTRGSPRLAAWISRIRELKSESPPPVDVNDEEYFISAFTPAPLVEDSSSFSFKAFFNRPIRLIKK